MKSFAVNDRFKKKTQCLHFDKIWSPKKRHDFTMKTHTHTHTHTWQRAQGHTLCNKVKSMRYVCRNNKLLYP